MTLFGLLFLPSLFFFYLHDHDAIARKEILGYVTLLLHLLIIEKSFPLGGGSTLPDGNLRRYVLWLMPVAVILLPAIILVHEGNFLLFVPLHGMITLTVLRMKARRYLPAGSPCGPGCCTFLQQLRSAPCICPAHPATPTLLGICNKWAAAGALQEGTCILPPDQLSGSTLPGSFIPMEWSLAQAAHFTQGNYFHALGSLASDPAGVGNFPLVSRPAGAVFHSPFPLPAVLLPAFGAALFGLVLLQVFLDPAAVFPARLLHGLRLRPMVHGHLH